VIGTIFFRLPVPFLIAFFTFLLVWTLVAFRLLDAGLRFKDREFMGTLPILSGVNDILIAFLIIAVNFAGLIAVYNLSVLASLAWLRLLNILHAKQAFEALKQRLRRHGLWRQADKPQGDPVVAQPHRPAAAGMASDRLRDVRSIGIVLAGGGAKGAYQAGAMRAIYQFLVANGALDKVKVIAGTSIGAWNALFWLADLIEPASPGAPSPHENWWRSISLRSLITPSWYIPGFRNCFFQTEPWHRSFENIFLRPDIRKRLMESKTTFYFTCSRVLSGQLDCVTNNQNESDIPKVTFKKIDQSNETEFFDGLKFGVFASMDLPPLFPYMKSEDDFFEDGGVVDNLPILFATMNGCDLIFVLPLNSDFHEIPDQRSVLYRFLRIMDVRQGALERSSLKVLYLYNELAVLRKHVEAIREKVEAFNPNTEDAKIELPRIDVSEETLLCSLQRKHDLSKIFAICPHRSFVESMINTHELWKAKEAGAVFKTMQLATKNALADFKLGRERIGVWLVDVGGTLSWKDDVF
jgi:predicted acylesterase/phospholipase RssA